ncbi:hybrid sensor histidine kinase/response regulator [Mastigocoleus testarum]|uniref:histidine kinase n=1 Tax=Mastigocoleus testarum BC008 TaxID=371196 RepID=A0A0V7ZQB1_9CYAN|nr:response regulator [Mastigocoleus testarum]KST66551.1 histidine kinase [Mastigocoleus testarum BC008]
MSQDKELEIQMQFLEEATDYLNTLEAVLLEIDPSSNIPLEKINAALRAAHSIKGGAAMMGFRALSDLAHRLEDCFKVLKTRKSSLDIDTELQSLLISGVDWLRQIVDLHSEGHAIEEQWLANFCYPVFEELHERLGDPAPEDVSTMLSPEEGQNIIPLLFQTEVEGSLERLESIVSQDQQAGLKEELTVMAAELGGLGEMLELTAFTQLCQSIANRVQITDRDGELSKLARAALEVWRRSQALVLTNQIDNLPVDIDLEGISSESISSEGVNYDVISPENIDSAVETPPVDSSVSTNDNKLDNTAIDLNIEDLLTNSEAETQEEENFVVNSSSQQADATWLEDEVISTDFEALEAAFAREAAEEVVEETQSAAANREEISTTDYKLIEHKAENNFAGNKSDTPENTVRVPSKQLEQINDLFGELVIQRNGLNLQLERLRKLIRSLNKRVQTLDRENHQLRTAYDKIATGSSTSLGVSPLTLPGSKAPDNSHSSDDEVTHNGNGEDNKLDLGDDAIAQSINSSFDALEMDRYNELNFLSQEVMETIVQVQEVATDIELSIEDTDQISRKLNKTSKQLQRKLTQIRMRPLGDVVDRFPRAVRDMSVEHGKNVQLKVEGANTLIERSILESLGEPLMHLMRNAFDHGIEDPVTRTAHNKPESGLIEIKACHRRNRTVITMRDDGRGIDLGKIRQKALEMGLDKSLLDQATEEELLSLIFEPGFSTSEKVTSLSGRGVGMDVVRNNLKQIRGDITVNTEPGQGTTFTLSVPFTLSVARVLLVESNRMLLAFPTDIVEEIFLLEDKQVNVIGTNEFLNWQDKDLTLIRLSKYLRFNCVRYDNPDLEAPAAINASSVLIVKGGNQQLAMQVDRTWGEMEVAVRQVEGDIHLPEGFSNCTILGDGRVVPLVNINELLYGVVNKDRSSRSNKLPSAKLKTAFLLSGESKPPESSRNRKGKILIVDDSINVRRFLALTLEKAGYSVEQAKDGQDGLEKLDSGLEVQAVICDIEMPRIDGYGFLGRIKANAKTRDIPVAMLTSRSSNKHKLLAMQLGAVAYFSKPYNEQDLLKTLEEIIYPVAGTTAK